MTSQTKIPKGKWSGKIPDFARRLRDRPRGPIKFAPDEGAEVWRAAQG